MKFIKLTLDDTARTPILIMPSTIVCIEPQDEESTRVSLSNTRVIVVHELVDDIVNLLNGEVLEIME